MKSKEERNPLEKNANRVTDKKLEQIPGGCEPVNLPDGVVITDGYECRKCGFICPTGKPPYKCPACGGSDWKTL